MSWVKDKKSMKIKMYPNIMKFGQCQDRWLDSRNSEASQTSKMTIIGIMETSKISFTDFSILWTIFKVWTDKVLINQNYLVKGGPWIRNSFNSITNTEKASVFKSSIKYCIQIHYSELSLYIAIHNKPCDFFHTMKILKERE